MGPQVKAALATIAFLLIFGLALAFKSVAIVAALGAGACIVGLAVFALYFMFYVLFGGDC